MGINVALAGNPNSGKTTIYNVLTGSAQYVGNWPGVTVEKKAGTYKKNKEVTIVDLPGIYSLSPYTLEEVISRDYLLNEKPDVILNMVDASNIERNLYLTTQLLELEIPVVIALNMIDIVNKRGDKIDIAKLEKDFGCKVMEISALKNTGITELMQEVVKTAQSKKKQEVVYRFSKTVEDALSQIQNECSSLANATNKRWTAIKLFERDEKLVSKFNFGSDKEKIESIITNVEKQLDDDSESIITNERYDVITKTISSAVQKIKMKMTPSDKIDSIVTNRILALPIFIGVMWLVYYISVSTIGTMGSDFINDNVFGDEGYVTVFFTNLLENAGVNEILSDLILSGIIGGVGAVLGFLPLIIVLYLCLGILEDVGYMSRVAFVMDRIFRKFGLSGKSFIPFLIGTGCSVPGIMGSRTIESEKDRRMTVIITSFMPCGAKAPIIALIAAAAFDGASWVGPLTYVLGIVAIVVSGIILKKTKMFAGDPAPFVMELPQYHMPAWKNVLLHVWERTKSFAMKAGTVILASSIILWFLMSFTPSMEYIAFDEDSANSILAIIGNSIAPIFIPLGFGSWEATVATFTGLIAKENVISTMGIVSGIGEIDPEGAVENAEFVALSARMFAHGAIGAFSFMLFNLFCIPCFAAVGAIKREMASPKWTWFALGYQTLFAYVVAFITYQLGIVFFAGESFGIGSILALLMLVGSLYLLFRTYKVDETVSIGKIKTMQ